MIVFRYPREPAKKYVDRLIGLPGETIHIQDGSIWIDGVKAELPPHLAGLEYVTEHEFGRFRGAADDPIRLGAEEYCVLGDFSLRSSDSRDWGAVPAENVEGVVCLTYVPLARWKVHR